MKKKLLALLLVFALSVTLLAACAKTEKPAPSDNKEPAQTETPAPAETPTEAPDEPAPTETPDEPAPAETPAEPAPAETPAEPDEPAPGNDLVDWDDIEEIVVTFACLGPVPDGVAAVEDALNEITEEKIHTHVTLQIVEMGNYPQQISLAMSSGEQLDLMMAGFATCAFGVMQPQGQLVDITDLAQKYAQPTLDLVGRLAEGTTVDGRLYGISAYVDKMTGVYYAMRTDVLEDLGLLEQAKAIKNMDDIEAILMAVKNSEKWSYLAPIVGTANGNLLQHTYMFDVEAPFESAFVYDNLGDSLGVVGVDENGKVVSVTEEPVYRAMYERLRDWDQKNLIHKDSAITMDMGNAFVKDDAAFSYFTTDNFAVETNQAIYTGRDITCVKLIDFPIATSACRGFGWCVPATSQSPEAAVAFMNLTYTDPVVSDLLAWGILGVDYEVVDGYARYIEGNESPAYHYNDFMFGNQMNVTPWEGSLPNLREDSLESMAHAVYSDYMGFNCDTSSIVDQIAAVSSVREEYRKTINTGIASEAEFNEYIEKLHAAGIDKIIECYQTQLDAFLAAKG